MKTSEPSSRENISSGASLASLPSSVEPELRLVVKLLLVQELLKLFLIELLSFLLSSSVLYVLQILASHQMSLVSVSQSVSQCLFLELAVFYNIELPIKRVRN